MKEFSIKIAVIGFGTVGMGVVKIVQERAEHIYQKTGVRLELAHVVDTDIKRDRQVQRSERLGVTFRNEGIDVGQYAGRDKCRGEPPDSAGGESSFPDEIASQEG